MSKPGLLTLTIKHKSALYLAYMPFISNGGTSLVVSLWSIGVLYKIQNGYR